jgi:hypothetical protein
MCSQDLAFGEDVSILPRVYRDEFPMMSIAALRPFQHLQKRSALLMPTNWITIPTPTSIACWWGGSTAGPSH